jgi:hypothetical protein
VYTKCKELDLPKVDSDRPVKDFAYAVESITLSWLEYWKNQFKRLKWKKKTLPTFFELVEIYRNHRRTELAQKGKNPQGGSFAVTFKDEWSESPNSKPDSKPELPSADEKKEGRPPPLCLCGQRHFFNQCWYIAESTRPPWLKPNAKIQKKVEEKC